jgi:hypothetical protein
MTTDSKDDGRIVEISRYSDLKVFNESEWQISKNKSVKQANLNAMVISESKWVIVR